MIGLLCHGLIFHYLIYVARVKDKKKITLIWIADISFIEV